MSIIVQNLSRRFRDFEALKDVSLSIHDGELLALLGPSGSGKTTLLRIIAGLEPPDKGTVSVGEEKNGKAVGFVFQHYALFKHMSVFENVAFGLRMRKGKEQLTETQIRRKVMKLLSLVHLENMHRRYPSQLSGGQRQRVALARALAVEPKVLLLDEPFGALDAKVRKELRRWLRRLHEELGITTIFVTHDQEEAMEMADRVVVLNAGRIEQLGTPEEVYLKPANAFVYDFLGHYNEFDAWQMADGTLLLKDSEKMSPTSGADDRTGEWFTRLPVIGKLLSGGKTRPRLTPHRRGSGEDSTQLGTPVKVFCRPHELKVHSSKQPGTVMAWLTHINPAGPLVKLELERQGGGLLDAELPRGEFDGLKLKRGQKLFVRPGQMKVFA